VNPDGDFPAGDESPRGWRTRPPEPTLGQRLQRQASDLAVRHLPEFGWLRPFEALRERIVGRGQLSGERFARRELTHEETHAARVTPSLPVPVTAAATPGRAPEPTVRERLRDAVGPAAAEAVRVHESQPPESVGAEPKAEAVPPAAVPPTAEAVTMGRDVYFAPGRYRPHEPAGYGLLVHEATHVLHALAPDAAWQRATSAGVREEEGEAAQREREASESRQSLSLPTVAARRGAERRPAVTATSVETAPTSGGSRTTTSAAARPMTAMPGRAADLDESEAPELDVAALREQIYRDLMGRLRSEFERGA
jgi:hypothetical protein